MAAKALYLYYDILEQFENYTLEQIGGIVIAMLEYAAHGIEPEFKGPEIYIWPALKSQIDRDLEKYARICRQNAEKARRKGMAENELVSTVANSG